jgi:hypothetical protein
MRWVLLSTAVALSLSGSPPAPVPVVVELFTSEGCSSCPPADQLLSALLKDQPVAGAEVIPLSMHVTYWDQLGWKDPASSSAATARQHDYSRVFGEDRVYTPQAVIDGREELVGSDESGVKRAVAKAAAQPHARLIVTAVSDRNVPGVSVTVTDVPGDIKESLELVYCLVEDGLTSIVKRGENGGRTLRHDAVVRTLQRSGAAVAFQSASRASFPGLSHDWRRENLRVVVMLQGQKSRRIWGAAATPLK